MTRQPGEQHDVPETLTDQYCPACFNQVPVVPVDQSAFEGRGRWVYGNHERVSTAVGQQDPVRCIGSGLDEHAARQAW